MDFVRAVMENDIEKQTLLKEKKNTLESKKKHHIDLYDSCLSDKDKENVINSFSIDR